MCLDLSVRICLQEICTRTGGCGDPDEVFSLILEISSIIGVILSISCLTITIVTLVVLIV